MQNDHDLWTGCISGAWYEPEFISDFKKLGFKNLKFAESSTMTLKMGIERKLKEMIPEISEVVQVL